MALIAVLCKFCYSLLPTVHAWEFQRAVRSGNYAYAERLFTPGSGAFPATWGTPAQIRKAQIEIAPLTLDALINGERYVYVHVPYGNVMGEYDWDIVIRATPQGLTIFFAMT